MNETYVKLLRKITEWEWYHDSKMVHLFIHLMITCQAQKRNYAGVELERGQCIIALRPLSAKLGIPMQSLRTCLERLKSTREVTLKVTHQFTIVTLTQYDLYQSASDGVTRKSTRKVTHDQHTSNTRPTQEQEGKKERSKEEYNDEQLDLFAKFNDWITEHTPLVRKMPIQFTIKRFLAVREKYGKEDMVEILKRMNNWKPLLEKNTSAPDTFDTFIKRMLKDRYNEQQSRIAR